MVLALAHRNKQSMVELVNAIKDIMNSTIHVFIAHLTTVLNVRQKIPAPNVIRLLLSVVAQLVSASQDLLFQEMVFVFALLELQILTKNVFFVISLTVNNVKKITFVKLVKVLSLPMLQVNVNA